ncbi:TPA: MerR family transcriptional regulator [Stenotrophomonas maltophilia]
MDFKIGHLARVAGCNVQSIRNYEILGLMPPARRSKAGHRRYNQADLDRLIAIRRARRLGVSLSSIRTMIESGQLDRPQLGSNSLIDLITRK